MVTSFETLPWRLQEFSFWFCFTLNWLAQHKDWAAIPLLTHPVLGDRKNVALATQCSPTPPPMSYYSETDFQNRKRYPALGMQQFSSQKMGTMTLQMRKATAKGEFMPWGVSWFPSRSWVESIFLLSPGFGSDLCLFPWFEDILWQIQDWCIQSHSWGGQLSCGSQCRARNEKCGRFQTHLEHCSQCTYSVSFSGRNKGREKQNLSTGKAKYHHKSEPWKRSVVWSRHRISESQSS